MQDRSEAIAELAQRILTVAEATYANAPKLMLPGMSDPPPPIQWHASYTGAQFAESMMRLCVLRKVERDALVAALAAANVPSSSVEVPNGFSPTLRQCEREANRMLEAFGIQLAQEI